MGLLFTGPVRARQTYDFGNPPPRTSNRATFRTVSPSVPRHGALEYPESAGRRTAGRNRIRECAGPMPDPPRSGRGPAGLDLSVPEGGVFGFLGANGPGKTTAIRAAAGLLRGAKGRIQVLGADSPRNLPSVIGGVGALVEQPS